MSEQKWRCPAAINIAGKHYECDTEVLGGGPHTGWPHSNTEAEAIWTEDRTQFPDHRQRGRATDRAEARLKGLTDE